MLPFVRLTPTLKALLGIVIQAYPDHEPTVAYCGPVCQSERFALSVVVVDRSFGLLSSNFCRALQVVQT
jgi:hypothetical protein